LRRWSISQLPVVGTWLIGALWFFRGQWESGFQRLNGYGGDNAFIIYILENWFRALHGQASWANPAIFYPYKGLLGWSDGLVLFEVLYAPLRWLGLDELLAAEFMIIGSSLLGFLTFVALVRRLFPLPLLVALAGGLAFTFANGLYVESSHYQLLAVWFLPGIALLAVEASTTASRRRACVFGALAGALYGLLFFTSFYTAWFCVPLGAVAVAVAVLLNAQRLRRALAEQIPRLWPAIVAAGVAFVVALIPFAATYLPVRSEVPSDSYPFVIAAYAHGFHGAFDLSAGDLAWSSILLHFHAVFTPDQGSAITPVLLVGSTVSAVAALVASRRRRGAFSPRSVVAVALAVTTLVAFVLPIRYHDQSLWILMWHVPGGTAIRAIWRIGLMASAMAVTSLMASVSELWDRAPAPPAHRAAGRRSYRRPVLAALVLLVVFEQIDVASNADFDRPNILAFLRSVPKPPSGCRSFYMTRTSSSPVPDYSFQMDAELVSQRLDLPTIDGYSGYSPTGWDLSVFGAQLDVNARQWAARYHLTGVCRLDVSHMTWTPASTAPGG
jgi:hypothetical protein